MYVPEYGCVHMSTGACGDQKHQRSLELQVINKPLCMALRPPARTVSPLTPEPSLPSPDTLISKCGT